MGSISSQIFYVNLHAECANSRKMPEPDFDFHFQTGEMIVFPHTLLWRSHQHVGNMLNS